MKEFLQQRGVPYVEKYVDQDRAAAIEMIRKSGQQGVPVTVIGDDVVIGFDRARLERILDTLSAGGTRQTAASSTGGRKPLGAKVADASKYALPSGGPMQGAYVGGVKPGSPADTAGVRVGDIIVEVGDKPVRSADDLSATLGKLNAGRTNLKLQRGTNTRTVAVDL